MRNHVQKNKTHVLSSGTVVTKQAIGTVENVMNKAAKNMDSYIRPIRTSVLTRYPILFSLLTTLGVATTFLGFEKIVSQIPFLDQHPFVMLILGVGILAVTGTLYKKLS